MRSELEDRNGNYICTIHSFRELLNLIRNVRLAGANEEAFTIVITDGDGTPLRYSMQEVLKP